MSTYERVSFRAEGAKRSRTIYLRDAVQSTLFLTGIEVDKTGDEISGKGFDERRHVISVELVERRVPMVMDNNYGWLVEPQPVMPARNEATR